MFTASEVAYDGASFNNQTLASLKPGLRLIRKIPSNSARITQKPKQPTSSSSTSTQQISGTPTALLFTNIDTNPTKPLTISQHRLLTLNEFQNTHHQHSTTSPNVRIDDGIYFSVQQPPQSSRIAYDSSSQFDQQQHNKLTNNRSSNNNNLIKNSQPLHLNQATSPNAAVLNSSIRKLFKKTSMRLESIDNFGTTGTSSSLSSQKMQAKSSGNFFSSTSLAQPAAQASIVSCKTFGEQQQLHQQQQKHHPIITDYYIQTEPSEDFHTSDPTLKSHSMKSIISSSQAVQSSANFESAYAANAAIQDDRRLRQRIKNSSESPIRESQIQPQIYTQQQNIHSAQALKSEDQNLKKTQKKLQQFNSTSTQQRNFYSQFETQNNVPKTLDVAPSEIHFENARDEENYHKSRRNFNTNFLGKQLALNNKTCLQSILHRQQSTVHEIRQNQQSAAKNYEKFLQTMRNNRLSLLISSKRSPLQPTTNANNVASPTIYSPNTADVAQIPNNMTQSQQIFAHYNNNLEYDSSPIPPPELLQKTNTVFSSPAMWKYNMNIECKAIAAYRAQQPSPMGAYSLIGSFKEKNKGNLMTTSSTQLSLSSPQKQNEQQSIFSASTATEAVTPTQYFSSSKQSRLKQVLNDMNSDASTPSHSQHIKQKLTSSSSQMNQQERNEVSPLYRQSPYIVAEKHQQEVGLKNNPKKIRISFEDSYQHLLSVQVGVDLSKCMPKKKQTQSNFSHQQLNTLPQAHTGSNRYSD